MGQPKVNVLLLEEDATSLAELQAGLRNAGCDVVAIRDGRAGLARAVSQRFDVIVVSAELPGMNGFRVCNRIKKDTHANRVPLVMTGHAATEFEAHRALPTRADGYLQKPLRLDELLARIRMLVQAEAQVQTVPAEAAPPEEIEAADILEDEALLSEPPPAKPLAKERQAVAGRMAKDLAAGHGEAAALRELKLRLLQQEARVETLTRELAEARASAVVKDTQTKELELLRRALATAHEQVAAEKALAAKRAEDTAKRLEGRRLDVERIHQDLIAERKARAADAAAHLVALEKAVSEERRQRDKERADYMNGIQSLAETKDRSRAAEVERQRSEHEIRIKTLVRELEEARRSLARERDTKSAAEREARAELEAKLSELQTEHGWEVSALTALLEQERAESASVKSAHDAALHAAQSEAQTARNEVGELEAEIVVLRAELSNVRRQLEEESASGRATTEQLERNRVLLERARTLLDDLSQEKS